MIIIKSCVTCALFFLLALNTYAYADDFHYNNILIGDRASGMGGAYTAISDDASGLYYNPAGIVYASDRNFSASVNAYSAQTKTYNNVVNGQPFVRKSSALLANYFGIIRPIGNLKFGFSYAVPDSVGEDLNLFIPNIPSTTPSDFTLYLSNKDNTYNFGPTLATAINNDLAVGATLYIHQRDSLLIVNQFVAYSDNTNSWTNEYTKFSESGIRPVFGITWAPVEKLSLGASVSQTILFNSVSSQQLTCADNSTNPSPLCGNPPLPFKTPNAVTHSAQRVYPIRLAFGAAYFASSNLLLSTDLTYHTAAIQKDTAFFNKVATLDAAFGTEYYINKKLALRAGLFTTVSNSEPIVVGVLSAEERINLYGVSLSITSFTGDSSVTLGGSVSYGKGLSQIASINEVQDATTFGWTMFLSSAY